MAITVADIEAVFPCDKDAGDLVAFEYDEGIEKFVGDIVHRDFRGVSIPDRQKWIWDRLKQVFGEDAEEVSLVLAYTPEEWEEGQERAAG